MSESGRVKGVMNVKKFDEFIFNHNQENDWYKYINKSGKKINKELICNECGFGKSAIIQNPTLKNKFENLEQDLMKKGILMNQPSQKANFYYTEQEVFSKAFEEKIIRYKGDVDKLKNLISFYSQELDLLDK